MPEQIEIIMTAEKPCKHSIRFATENDKAAVTNVYISRNVPGIDKARRVKITLEVLSD